MTADARPLVPEELLAHAGFVRALAARLLARDDQDDVDDVAQSTWLATLTAPPRERAGARGWLGRVVRNLVFERHRSDVARSRRERVAAPPEALVSTHELAAKDEMLRRVADAVLALDEKHRAVVLLRFYDGSPTADVARRLGLPLETARSRLKRALVLLREELDRGAGGAREQWLGALAAAVGWKAPAAASATAKLVLSAALAVVLVGGIWIGTRVARTKDAPTATSAAAEAAAPPPAAAPRSEPAPTRSPVEPDPKPEVAAAAAPAVPRAPETAVGTLRASVVDAKGRVVSDAASLSVRPAGSNEPAKTVRGRIDHDHPQLVVDDAPVGEVDVEMKLDHRPAGTLKAVATIRATQVTELALPFGGPDPATTVCVRLDWAAADATLAGTLVATDERTIASTFVPEALPFLVFSGVGAGAWTLKIADPRYRPIEVAGLHAGDAIAVEIRGSAGLRVVVRSRSGAAPIRNVKFTFAHESAEVPGFVVESGGSAEPPDADGTYTIDELEPEAFTLVVHVEGVVSRRVPIAALAPGEVRAVEVLLDAGAGAGSIEGVLFASDAVTPLENRAVDLYAPAKVDDSADSTWFFIPPETGDGSGTMSFGGGGDLDTMRVGKARATTDATGRFRFAGLAPGRWILRHVNEAGIDTVLDPVVLDADHPTRDDVEMIENEGATLVGRLVTAAPADFSKMRIKLAVSPKDAFQARRMESMLEGVPIAADGSFRIGPLPAGPTELRIDDPAPVTVHGMNADQTFLAGSGDGVPLTKVTLPAGGETKVEVPADAFVPGTIRVAVVVDGAPRAKLRVTATRRDGSPPDFARGTASDADGRATLGPMLPGALMVSVSSAEGWTVADAAKVALAARGSVDALVTIQTTEGTVTFRGRDGALLCERSVFVATPFGEFGVVGEWKELRTDADGRVTLRRPIGAASFASQRDELEDSRIVVVPWTAEGPKSGDVQLR